MQRVAEAADVPGVVAGFTDEHTTTHKHRSAQQPSGRAEMAKRTVRRIARGRLVECGATPGLGGSASVDSAHGSDSGLLDGECR